MSHLRIIAGCLAAVAAIMVGLPVFASSEGGKGGFENYTLSYDSPVNPALQAKLETIDRELRGKYGMTSEQVSVGMLDLTRVRLAMIHPDRIDYAASVAKIGILLAYFQLHPEAATNLNPTVRHELGLMAKPSSNEMAAKYSRELGLRKIQQVLDSYGFYDAKHGGGLWVGRHYGGGGERIGDPLADHSHAATVRQVMRYFLFLEQGRLVSAEASKKMREIFLSPDIPHDEIKFVKGLAGREVEIIRKWGSWQDWLHDAAVITGADRHYILVAMTHHAKGDEYLVDLARAVDDLMLKDSKDEKAKAKLKAERMLFLGNSITCHGPMPSIGWTNNWGMAASAPEKDYVHLLAKSVGEWTGREPEIKVAGLGEFEKGFQSYDAAAKLQPLLAFKPDVVVVAIGENVAALKTEQARADFRQHFAELLKVLKNQGKSTVFVRSTFWAEPTRDRLMREACVEAGAVFVDLSELGKDESNIARAERSYSHAGVGAHPGDKGMKAIADGMFQAITNAVSE